MCITESQDALIYITIGFVSNYFVNKIYNYLMIDLKEKKLTSDLIKLFDRIKIDSDIRLLENKLIRNKEELKKNKKILNNLKDEIRKIKEVEFASKEDRGKRLAVLYEKEEKIELIVSELDECIDNDTVELEEFHEKLDTLAELHEMEKKIDLRGEFEKEILQYKHKIRKLNELLKLKDNLINTRM